MRIGRRGAAADGPTLEEAAKRLPSRRMAHRKGRVYLIAGVAAIAVGALAVVAFVLATPPAPAKPGPTAISITLGSSTLLHVPCSGSSFMYGERIPWLSSTGNASTVNVSFAVIDVGEGNEVGTNNGPAGASPTNPCVGAPLSGPFNWYIVLQDPSGTNLATFTVRDGWQPIPPTTGILPLDGGETILLVSDVSLAGISYTLQAEPVPGGPAVSGVSAL